MRKRLDTIVMFALVGAIWPCAILSLSACDTSSLTTTTTQGEITPNTHESTTVAGEHHIVNRVVDGDTAIIDGKRTRFIGVNSPESVDPHKPVECFGPQASDFTKKLLPEGTEVITVFDVQRKDIYNRDLVYVYRASDGLFINADLVKEGYAKADYYAPNGAHKGEFDALQGEAQAAKRGLWGAC